MATVPQGKWSGPLFDNQTWDFVQAMLAAGDFSQSGDLMDFIEKPQKWNPEYDRWVELGRPNEDAETFQDFIDYLVERSTATS
jgi:hypothetical protein